MRSTHGVNCTGSCSWKIYVKGGIVTWETQQTDYPRTRADLPNHEPRGCARGASYSWYPYSANRVKYPMVRGRLLERWRAALVVTATRSTPGPASSRTPKPGATTRRCAARAASCARAGTRCNQLIAAANVYTIKTHGPDRVIGFSPIPAMSMVSYAAGSRYLSLIGGVCISFYRLILRPAAGQPAGLGEQTDVPESADWYNSNYIIAWGSNVRRHAPPTPTSSPRCATRARRRWR